MKLSSLIIAGEFNIHIDDDCNLFARSFISVMDSFNFIHYVSGPTHSKGHTLYLVFTVCLNIDCLSFEDIVSSRILIVFILTCPSLLEFYLLAG